MFHLDVYVLALGATFEENPGIRLISTGISLDQRTGLSVCGRLLENNSLFSCPEPDGF